MAPDAIPFNTYLRRDRVKLSIVIPTKNRLPALRNTVEALTEQALGEHEAEVVIVDNGSTDGTLEWLEHSRSRFPMPFEVFSEPTPGVSAARNAGVRRARHDYILFLNDDTAPADRGLVAGHASAHRMADGMEIAVLGRITYPPDQLADPFMRWINDGAQFDYARLDGGEPPRACHFYTAHISFPRGPFERAKGMDERLRFGFEDAALGHRIAQQGVSIHYHPELVVHHDHPIDLTAWHRRVAFMGGAGWHINALYRTDPPLAQPAAAPYWRALQAAAQTFALIPTDWSWLPSPIRERVYAILNQGFYARGYRQAMKTAKHGLWTLTQDAPLKL
jgi:GT2 family glycosyltransferase